MTAFSGSISPAVTVTATGPLGVQANSQNQIGLGQLRGLFGSGSLSDQFAYVHSKTYNFLASTPITLNLNNGSLLDPYGNACPFSNVRYFMYRIQSTTTGFVIVAGGAGSNPWNGYLIGAGQEIWYPSSSVNDGYVIRQAPNLAGMTVSSGSCELLLNPGSNAVGLVDIIIAGS